MIRHRYVYFVQCPSNGLIKIGTTGEKPNKRFADLERGSPWPIERLAVIGGGRETEQRLHFLFHEYRSHGEWFRPGQEIMELIAKNGEPWPDGHLAFKEEYLERIAVAAQRCEEDYIEMAKMRLRIEQAT